MASPAFPKTVRDGTRDKSCSGRLDKTRSITRLTATQAGGGEIGRAGPRSPPCSSRPLLACATAVGDIGQQERGRGTSAAEKGGNKCVGSEESGADSGSGEVIAVGEERLRHES